MEQNSILLTEDFVKVNDDIYFILKYMNIVAKFNMQSKKIEFVGSIPEESIFQQRVASKIIYWNQELIFIPMNAKKIWVYELDKGKWKNIELRNEKISLKFFQAILVEDKLYIIGHRYPAIICMDLLQYKIEYIEEPYKKLLNMRNIFVNDGYFICEYVQSKNKIIMASSLTNAVLCFNLQSKEYEIKRIGEKDDRYAGIATDGKNIVLAPRENGNIIIWDGKENYKKVILPPLYMKDKNFLGIVYDNGKFVMGGMNGKKTLKLELNNKDIKIELEDNSYVCYQALDRDMIIKEDINGNVSVSHKGNKIIQTKLFIESKDMIKYILKKNNSDLLINENPLLGIKEFILMIK